KTIVYSRFLNLLETTSLQRPHRPSRISRSEDRGSRHKSIGSGAPHGLDGLDRDPTIHLQRGTGTFAVEQGAGPLDLSSRRRYVGLAAESGVYTHDEQQVEIVNDLGGDLERRRRHQCQPGHHASFPDMGQMSLDMYRRFGMEGEDRGTQVGVLHDVALRL